MTSRMTSLDLFEQFDCLNDLLIAEAEIPNAHKATVLPTPRSKGRLSSFVNSGWGVAIVCALVAASVMSASSAQIRLTTRSTLPSTAGTGCPKAMDAMAPAV